MMETTDEFLKKLEPLVVKFSSLFVVDPNLVRAFIKKETAGDPWRTKTEPAWKYFVFPAHHANKVGITIDTEKILQSMSWGPMQVMGSVARELGFEGNLTQMVLPENGLFFGVKKLAKELAQHPNFHDAIASYNAGSPRKTPVGDYVNQGYVDTVVKYYSEFQKQNATPSV